jgi:hypothetical protein
MASFPRLTFAFGTAFILGCLPTAKVYGRKKLNNYPKPDAGGGQETAPGFSVFTIYQ